MSQVTQAYKHSLGSGFHGLPCLSVSRVSDYFFLHGIVDRERLEVIGTEGFSSYARLDGYRRHSFAPNLATWSAKLGGRATCVKRSIRCTGATNRDFRPRAQRLFRRNSSRCVSNILALLSTGSAARVCLCSP